MKKFKAFTLIEVMISIFVFSSAMLGFMAFHAHTMAVLFENESAQFAHSLAFNMIDEINAMSYDSFHEVQEYISTKNGWMDDNDDTLKTMFGSDFKESPFNSFGKQVAVGGDNYLFCRSLQVDTYAKKTQVYVQNGTYLSTLYHIEVRVAWPKKENPTQDCCASNYKNDKCNAIIIPLVRSDENYK